MLPAAPFPWVTATQAPRSPAVQARIAAGAAREVSAVGRNGHQLGSPASRDHVIPVRTVVLAPGATAHAILRYGDVEVATSPGCHPTYSTFELRIYPPGQYRATYAAFGLEACSHAGPGYLSVEPVQSGVGTRSG